MSSAEEQVRAELMTRRDQVARLAGRASERHLVELLVQVDNAIGRLDTPDWGHCVACQAVIENERLTCDPLVSVCLECLSTEERQALERDLASAARVQRALMPPREMVHGDWKVAWLWEPKGAVSGDWVDFIASPDRQGSMQLVLGDVVGKGVAASFLQAYLHAMFRALAGPELALTDLLARANRLFFAATTEARYATLIAARLETGGAIELATAGHPRPLLADRRGVRPVEGSGLPIGLFADADYKTRQLSLRPGDTLLLYSDGLTEAARDDEEYGIGRAAAALGRSATLAIAELVAACRQDLAVFLDGAPRSDDLTLLAVRRR